MKKAKISHNWVHGRRKTGLCSKTINETRFVICEDETWFYFLAFSTKLCPVKGKLIRHDKALLIDSSQHKIFFKQFEDCQTYCEFVNINKLLTSN